MNNGADFFQPIITRMAMPWTSPNAGGIDFDRNRRFQFLVSVDPLRLVVTPTYTQSLLWLWRLGVFIDLRIPKLGDDLENIGT